MEFRFPLTRLGDMSNLVLDIYSAEICVLYYFITFLSNFGTAESPVARK